MRILIANRGEIARRVIRTAHRLGHETVAIYGPPDADAPYVREATLAIALGSVTLSESFLSVERVLAAATAAEADAIHPGYGFLSENATFARTCEEQGMLWIGPSHGIIAVMGSKIEARTIAEKAGVPVIPGWAESQTPGELSQAAARIGYPVLVKASAGGGGKGIRIAQTPEEFPSALSEASQEAQRAFGDGAVIIEKYIQRPRHIEVQIVGDKHGAIAELGTRECSVQRRYQKLLEEAPAPNLPAETRRGLRDSARAIAKAVGYDSAGTVEFIVDDDTGAHYFLEMNTRLQVEHPVTEMITGLDLVEIMIRVAQNERLPLDPASLRFDGHAIEARILAEDVLNDFAPQIGRIHQVKIPDDVRWDSGIEPGSEVTPHYDSMIAKLIVHGSTRQEAITRMKRALDRLIIDGVTTTAALNRWMLEQPDYVSGTVTSRFLDENPMPQPADDAATAALAAAAIGWARSSDIPTAVDSPWLGSAFSVTPYEMTWNLGLVDSAGEAYEVSLTEADLEGKQLPPMLVDGPNRRVAVNTKGTTHSFDVPSRSQRWSPTASTRQGSGDSIVAPFPALVTEVSVVPGDAVEGNQVLIVIEAMKMLHSLRATGVAVVDEVRVRVGDQVATDDVLITFSSDAPDDDVIDAEIVDSAPAAQPVVASIAIESVDMPSVDPPTPNP